MAKLKNPLEVIDDTMGPRLHNVDQVLLNGGKLRGKRYHDIRPSLLVHNKLHRPERLHKFLPGRLVTNASPRR